MTKTAKKNILLGVTGSISAYKSVELMRQFMKAGYNVRVILTHSAQKFIQAFTFEAISGNAVMTDFWDDNNPEKIEHIDFADWADVFLIAPATADVIAKLNAGIADTPLLATALATKAPLVVAPAMNVNMYENIKTQRNINDLRKDGVSFVEPEIGELACGWIGAGRLASLEEIYFQVENILSKKDYKGLKVLVTAGPTREDIDPVRYISNSSSGKMGVSLAYEAYRRGAEVTLIHGDIEFTLPKAIKKVKAFSSKDMLDSVLKEYSEKVDVVFMAAAVADYKPINYSELKLKKSDNIENIPLSENTDILKELGELRKESPKPLIIGFALETGSDEQLVESAKLKLDKKRVDLIVANKVEDSISKETNCVQIIDKSGKLTKIPKNTKSEVSREIFNFVSELI